MVSPDKEILDYLRTRHPNDLGFVSCITHPAFQTIDLKQDGKFIGNMLQKLGIAIDPKTARDYMLGTVFTLVETWGFDATEAAPYRNFSTEEKDTYIQELATLLLARFNPDIDVS